MRPLSKRLLLSLSEGCTVGSGTIAALAFLILPVFTEGFEAHGRQLPTVTMSAVSNLWVWIPLPVLTSLLTLDIWRREQLSPQYKIVAGTMVIGACVLSIVLLAGLIIALYAPRFTIVV